MFRFTTYVGILLKLLFFFDSASSQLCSEHDDFAKKIRNNLGLAQQGSLSHNTSHDDTATTSSRPILFGDTVGAPQWLANEIMNVTRSVDSASDKAHTDSAKAQPPPLLRMLTESESETTDARDADETTPIAPPTTQVGDSDTVAPTSKGVENSDGTEGQTLRRSSRKPVRRVRHYSDHYSDDSETTQSDSQTSSRKKRKSMLSVSSRASSKRHRDSPSETSGGEGDMSGESRAKRVCQRTITAPPVAPSAGSGGGGGGREGSATVDLEPLELGSKFKAEVEVLNKEESEVVSPLHVYMYNHECITVSQ